MLDRATGEARREAHGALMADLRRLVLGPEAAERYAAATSHHIGCACADCFAAYISERRLS